MVRFLRQIASLQMELLEHYPVNTESGQRHNYMHFFDTIL